MTPRAKTWIPASLTGAMVGAAVTAGIWAAAGRPAATAATRPAAAAAADEPKGTATVTAVPLRSGQVPETITAYGSVTAEPGVVTVLSVAVECRVRALRVAGGQSVGAGAAVIEVEPSPDAKLQLLDARNAADAAGKDAANARQRFDLKLATTADVRAADAGLRSAAAKLDDLTNRGAGEDHRVLAAATAGVVARVDVQVGQLVPAGGALVELVPAGQIEVRLGVEPADAANVRPGQAVRLSPTWATDEDEPIAAVVRLVTRRVGGDSRLVDVFAAPGETERLLLDGAVRGEVTLRTVSGLVVPHDALLPGDDGFSIFTVVDGKAVRHAVKVAVQTDKEAAITGDGLHEGDAVVVAGALELDDGAGVVVGPPAPPPSAAAEDGK